MTQNLSLYWHRLTHRMSDEDERAEAPVLDLAGCFGTPAIAALRQDGIVTRLGTSGVAVRPDAG
ncbi:MAG TPA: hypothetical protein VMH36_20315 [Alphaproteobacteria bacterium]|nr:hypothetical protein [Alphaproteobacteria bacterium]